jgi:hypothetical protein
VQAGAPDRNAEVFAALRTMGFKERDCRTAVARCASGSPLATRDLGTAREFFGSFRVGAAL